ncbi:amino acid permease [Bacillus paranthracis]|uniref:amino acid permease n=1 Tax=Bacillus paranthracis TaxID=2026186 RepID=UPI000200E3B7|nr:amino acid permease [Bacillus paranthracis]ADY22343.1 amino acid permease [Bacillus thuringiensis serovar finitimus YBT-020]MRC71014.1 amino acid permease [Bacillus thuringiensis]OTX69696.1 amino acid permease [Bacillus thuringiensis serovar finitimus]MCR6797465.1 amino acid permease [Bacillus paranthracis]MEC3355761.1 amino acid permease [Bacillus paranthracis]
MSNLLKKKSVTQLLEHNQSKTLTKTLGAFDLIMLGVGSIVGTGVLVLTGLVAARDAGPAVIFSFVLAAIICGFIALCYAEIAYTLPASGSVYTYSYATIGEFVAHLVGWSLLLIYIVATAAVAAGWTGYFHNLIKGFGLEIPKALVTIPSHGGIVNLPAVIITLILAWMLSRGTRESKRINNIMVLIKIGMILLFITVGIFYVKPTNWIPIAPYGLSGIFTGGAAILFAFTGFDILATSAEEVKDPKRNLPIGIIASLIICTIIYIMVCLVMTGMVSYKELNVPEAMAYVMEVVGQGKVAGAIAAGAVIGLMAVIFSNMYAATRVFFAMSRDGLLPKSFAKVNKKTGAPTFITRLSGIGSSIIAGFIDLKELVNLVNIGSLVTFALVCLSVIILRKSHPNLKRGFMVPFVPVLPSVSIVCCVFLMLNLPLRTWLYFSIWITIGAVIYFFYSIKHSNLNEETISKLHDKIAR